jgi:hypothetical protein
MRRITLLLLVLLAASIGRPLHAQDAGIHRCLDRAGHQVFTDRACADLDATPALPGGDATSDVPALPAEDRSSQLCAATPEELRQQIVDAFAARDPNRLAGLMLWDGYSRRGVVEQIRALGMLMQQPLLDVSDDGPARTVQTWMPTGDLYDASRPLDPETDAASAVAPGALTLVTGPRDASGASTSTRFPVVAQSGCLWLRPAD